MKLRRTKKEKSPSARGKAAAAPTRQARQQSRPFDNSAADGLPGKAGYPDGPNTSLPNFFNTRRPDGRNDRAPSRRKSGYSG